MHQEPSPLLPELTPQVSQEESSWPAFTDLLGAFVLVIFLGLLYFVIHLRQAESKVNEYGAMLTQREKRLKKSNIELAEKKRILSLQNKELEQKRQRLREKTAANLRLLRDLQETEKRLKNAASAKKELEQMLAQLKTERLQIEKERLKQEAALNKAELARRKCQRQVEDYIGVKRRIIQRVFGHLRKKLHNTPHRIRFNTKNGSIMFGAKVLYKAGSWKLQVKGRKSLRVVWTHLHQILRNPLNEPYIAGIMLEGHTSSEGNTSYNWLLSNQRALTALNYILRHGATYWSKKGLISSVGYGPTQPIFDSNGFEDKLASRRIEIRILFRDREQLERLMRQFKTKKRPPPPKTKTPQ